MRTKYCLLFFLFLLAVSNLLAQEIKGKVVDKTDGSPIGFSMVALINTTDSSIVGGAACNELGEFTLLLKEMEKQGIFSFKVSDVGHKVEKFGKYTWAELLAIQEKPLLFHLEKRDYELAHINVSAKRQLIRSEPGKIIVDVAGSNLSQGLNGADVLQRMPGVIMDNSGNISIKGKQGATVMINDKPTYLTSEQLLALLKSTSSSNISEIEVITQPGAQYDASGTAGMINIKMKRAKNEQFQAEVRAGVGQGIRYKSNIGFQVSEKRNKLGYLFSFDAVPTSGVDNIPSQRDYVLGEALQRQEVRTRYTINDNSFNPRGVLTYDFSDRSSLQSQVSYTYSKKFWRANNNNKIWSDDKLISDVKTVDQNPDITNNFIYGIAFQHKFDSAGKTVLKADIDLVSNNTNSRQSLRNTFQPIDTIAGYTNGIEMYFKPRTFVFAPKIDFEHKLNNSTQLSLGTKHVEVSNKNLNDQYYLSPTTTIYDSTNSNRYKYTERITSFYGIIKKEFSSKWNAEVGFRAERWYTHGEKTSISPLLPKATYNRSKWQAFPTLGMGYKISESKALNFSYGRRVERPSYNILLPYAYNVDPYSVYAGNPNLLPQLSNNIELTFSLFEGALTFTGSHFWAKNVIDENTLIRRNDTSRYNTILPINIKVHRNTGISMNYSANPTKWWQFNGFGNFYFNQSQTNINQYYFNNKRFSFMLQLTNSVKLGRNFEGEVFSMYQSYDASSLGFRNPMGMLNIGIKKSFNGGKGTFRLSGNDILKTQRYTWNETVIGMHNQGQYRGDFTNVMLSFTYRFGGEQKIDLRETDENLKRVGGK